MRSHYSFNILLIGSKSVSPPLAQREEIVQGHGYQEGKIVGTIVETAHPTRRDKCLHYLDHAQAARPVKNDLNTDAHACNPWEAEESLESWRQRLQWAEITPLHSGLGNRVRLHLKKQTNKFVSNPSLNLAWQLNSGLWSIIKSVCGQAWWLLPVIHFLRSR